MTKGDKLPSWPPCSGVRGRPPTSLPLVAADQDAGTHLFRPRPAPCGGETDAGRRSSPGERLAPGRARSDGSRDRELHRRAGTAPTQGCGSSATIHLRQEAVPCIWRQRGTTRRQRRDREENLAARHQNEGAGRKEASRKAQWRAALVRQRCLT